MASRNRSPLAAVLLLVVAALALKVIGSSGREPRQGLPAEKQIQTAQARRMPVWILVHSTMCQSCKVMERTASKVMPAFKGRVQFVDVLVDAPENKDLVRRLKVSVIPTSIFLYGSGKTAARLEGVVLTPEELSKGLSALEERR